MKTHKGKSCKETHPKMSHKKWEKGTESEMEEATTAAMAGAFQALLGVDPRFTKKKKRNLVLKLLN